jgi:hypothetical protein
LAKQKQYKLMRFQNRSEWDLTTFWPFATFLKSAQTYMYMNAKCRGALMVCDTQVEGWPRPRASI